MQAAAHIAMRGRPLSRPNPSVGCIIEREGKVIARGWTRETGRPHAEADALAGLPDATDASIYVTLEPCAHQSERGPACADLLVAAKPARVIIGTLDPDPRTSGKGIAKLQEAGIDVTVLEDAASRGSLAGYLTQARHERPFVTLKLAMSQDGFVARPPGGDQWITGKEARAHVHARRALQDAILVGGGTWRSDAPRLDVRLAGIEARSPRRLVLTRSEIEGVETISDPAQIHTMPDTQYLYVEGGAGTARAFLDAGLVDRLELYRAPIEIGKGLRAPDGLDDETLGAPNSNWQQIETCQLGSDHFTAYQRSES